MTEKYLPGIGDAAPAPANLPAVDGGHGGARPGAGRPLGAFNRSNRELREYLIKLTGRDAIVEHWKVAAVPIMSDRTKLLKLAKYFDCSLKEAFEIWHRSAVLVFPHAYPRLGTLELKPPGTPDEAVAGFGDFLFGIDGDEAEMVDITDLPLDALSRHAIEQAIAEEDRAAPPLGGDRASGEPAAERPGPSEDAE